MSATLLLPFARRLSDNLLVSPEEVSRGRGCNCVCPSCERPVDARHGTEKVWHFAHAKASNCANAYEKSVHELAKQLLRERKVVLVPQLVVAASAWDAFGRSLLEQQSVFDSRMVSLDTCVCGKPLGEVTPDVFGTSNGREVLIEITVFQRLMPDKRDRLVAAGKAVFEIDLSLFKTVQATRALLERELFENSNNRRWIFHPRQAEVVAQLEDVLQSKVAQSKVEFAACQERQATKCIEEDRAKADRAVKLSSQLLPRWQPDGPDTTAFLPNFSLGWRASFPPAECWGPARADFCSRLGLRRERVEQIMASYSKRSHLARTTPQELAADWAAALGVRDIEIYRYFREAGYILD